MRNGVYPLAGTHSRLLNLAYLVKYPIARVANRQGRALTNQQSRPPAGNRTVMIKQGQSIAARVLCESVAYSP